MKKSILLLWFALLMFACQEESMAELPSKTESETSAFTFSEEEVVKGRMRVKLKEEPVGQVVVRSSGATVTTNVRALDAVASELRFTHMERTFPPAGKFEERSRREGLHLWYDVWFSDEMPATRAVGQVLQLDGVEIAAPVLKIVSVAQPPQTDLMNYVTSLAATFPFNDPFLPQQWGFHNTGAQGWQQAGADIRVADVWQQYNGHPDIIIAIVDGGIALEHPDLLANTWVNKAEIAGNEVDDDNNGYVDDVNGYNFVSMRSRITPHRHGTHVAGTIGATNNNETGVSGIAGGDGTPNSGAKLMSCQIFEHRTGDYDGDGNISKQIGAAIKYGADNGAVISQNSWGYAVHTRATRYIDPSDKEAIDYFIKYAGCDNAGNQLPNSPMKGGLVLFASGNANSSNPNVAAPADYEKVLGVAAIAADYKKAWYSNYGAYMDISAPGGSHGVEGIYSTTIAQKGNYEYRQGTSMACPHVAGVAALVIEKYGVGKPGFTAAQLEEILLTTSYDLDEYNPQYAGKLGYGAVDAYAALNGKGMGNFTNNQALVVSSNLKSDGKLSFKVNATLAGDVQITIYNGTGNLVLRKQDVLKRYAVSTIDISRLAAGYYTLEVVSKQQKERQQFIKH